MLGSLLAAQERWEIPVYFLDDFLLTEEFVASMLDKYHAYRCGEETEVAANRVYNYVWHRTASGQGLATALRVG